MPELSGDCVLVRIFLGEADKWHHQPLSTALVERLRKDGFSGATVFHGVAGFGARRTLHSSHLLELSQDLPVVIELVEDPGRLPRLLEIIDELAPGRLVTSEPVKVLRPGRG